MRLSYRGIPYEAPTTEVEAIGVQPIGQYRGVPLTRTTLLVYHPPLPGSNLKYRGVAYTSQV